MNVALPLSIRPYEIQDVAPLCAAVLESREELRPWLPWCHDAYSVTDSRAWVEGQIAAFNAGSEYSFVIVDASGALLGGCGLNHLERQNRFANLGYWVRTSCTGKGVALKASHLLAEWTFAHTDFERLEILASVENSASLSVARRLGAVREGLLRNRLWLQGRAHDGILFSVLKTDYLKASRSGSAQEERINWFLLVQSLRLM